MRMRNMMPVRKSRMRYFAREEREQASYSRKAEMERETGIEPATSSLGSWRSTAELLPPGRSNEPILAVPSGSAALEKLRGRTDSIQHHPRIEPSPSCLLPSGDFVLVCPDRI